MLRRLGELLGLRLRATDGDIGRVHDLYFDDHHWTVRYLVVDTRHWLPGRRVLLSPASVRRTDWLDRLMVLGLSRQQIRQSPGVDTDKPVARQNAVLLRECYSLPYYWATGGYLWGRTPSAGAGPTNGHTARRPTGDPHLRSTRRVRGYRVVASDGEVGRVDGFLVDDVSWTLRYVVVSLYPRAAGTRVLVPSDWIAWVSWIELALHVDLHSDTLVSAPGYEPSRPVSTTDEARLRVIYGRDRARMARRSS